MDIPYLEIGRNRRLRKASPQNHPVYVSLRKALLLWRRGQVRSRWQAACGRLDVLPLRRLWHAAGG